MTIRHGIHPPALRYSRHSGTSPVRPTATGLVRVLASYVIALILAVGAPAASAAPIMWSLSGVAFVDGGTATGSFSYDPDANTVGTIAVTTSAGTSFAGATYAALPLSAPYQPSPAYLYFVPGGLSDLTGAPLLLLEFDLNLSDTPGPRLLTTTEYACADADCVNVTGVLRTTDAGFVTSGIAQAVPEPGSLALLAVGLFTLVATQRRRRRDIWPVQREAQ